MDLWDTSKVSTYALWESQEEGRREENRKIPEEIMTESFPKMKNMHLQIQEA